MPIKLQSSSGGSVTVNIPVTASNYNVTVPAATGTAMVSGNMPAFSVYTNDSSAYFASSTATKVRFNTLIFDTNNNFDAVTNYRFTPTVAGYYQFSAKVLTATGGSGGQQILYLYKNGSEIAEFEQLYIGQNATGTTGSYLAYANGSTDYFEMYGFQNSGSTQPPTTGQALTYFQAAMIRTA